MADQHKRVGKQHLIETAERLFTENGYKGVSIRMIAEASGVTKAALYYHFDSKAALFEEVMQVHTQRMNTVVQQAGQSEQDTLNKLQVMAWVYFQQVSHQRPLIHLFRHRAKEMNQNGKKRVFESMITAVLQPFDDVFREASLNGEMVDLPGEFSPAALLIGMMHSQAGFLRICHEQKLAKEHIDQLVELIWYGLASDRGRPGK